MILKSIYLFFLLASVPSMWGQATPTVINAGYQIPAIDLAPGALITLYATGVDLGGNAYFASATPLPTELGGVSVTVNAPAQSPPALTPIAMPLLSVTSVQASPATAAIMVQVPWNVFPGIVPGSGGTVVVSANGLSGPAIPVNFVESAVHVIQDCTTVITGGLSNPLTICRLGAQHADGSPVSAESPAVPGESIIFYALGLGKTSSELGDGAITPEPAPILENSFFQVDFEPDAPARVNPGQELLTPDYIGLSPGYVGLYQVNVTLPSTFPSGVPACDDVYASNLTITLQVVDSVDGGGICVAPAQ